MLSAASPSRSSAGYVESTRLGADANVVFSFLELLQMASPTARLSIITVHIHVTHVKNE